MELFWIFCRINSKKFPNVFFIGCSSTHMCYKSIYNNSKLTELHFKNNLETWGYLWYMKVQSNYSSLCEAMLCTESFLEKKVFWKSECLQLIHEWNCNVVLSILGLFLCLKSKSKFAPFSLFKYFFLFEKSSYRVGTKIPNLSNVH